MATIKQPTATIRPPNHKTHNLTPVTILVGPEKTPFTLYKEVLCYYSPYFRNAFDGAFREADDRAINFCDISVSTFRHVARWLHTEGTEDLEVAAMRAVEDEGDDGGSNATMKDKNEEDVPSFTASIALTDLFVFADAYDIRLLRNHVMDMWREEEIYIEDMEGIGMSNQTFLKAIKSLPATSSLYRYLLRHYASGFKWHSAANQAWLAEISNDLPPDFMFKFIVEQSREARQSKRPLYKDFYGWCKFHEHESDAEKQRCKELVARLRDERKNGVGNSQ